jgi:hypothetical protein
MGNKNRIFYGSQVAQIKPATTGWYYGSWYQPLGVQSVGMNTAFDTQQTFQLGALDLYNISENVPNVEVTVNKLLDGTAPLYLMSMGGRSGIPGANCSSFTTTELQNKGLGGLANNSIDFRLGIYDGITTSSTGDTDEYALCERMYVSRLNYTFPVDGNATEELSFVGNSKKWSKNDLGGTMTGYSFNAATLKASKLARRQFIDLNTSVLPTGSGGMPTGVGPARLQNITISADLGRENINELGAFAPRTRYATFPVEVTSEFQVVATVGDYVDAKDFLANSGCSIYYKNLDMLPIQINICGNTGDSSNLSIFLGSGNQLTSVNYTGGDTTGGNATVSYSFRNYNDFYMKATATYASGATV